MLDATNADMLDNITKSDVLTLFKSQVHYSSPTRAKISIHLASQKCPPYDIGKLRSESQLIEDPQTVGSSWKLTDYPGTI